MELGSKDPFAYGVAMAKKSQPEHGPDVVAVVAVVVVVVVVIVIVDMVVAVAVVAAGVVVVCVSCSADGPDSVTPDGAGGNPPLHCRAELRARTIHANGHSCARRKRRSGGGGEGNVVGGHGVHTGVMHCGSCCSDEAGTSGAA